jgi:hypothetical protein
MSTPLPIFVEVNAIDPLLGRLMRPIDMRWLMIRESVVNWVPVDDAWAFGWPVSVASGGLAFDGLALGGLPFCACVDRVDLGAVREGVLLPEPGVGEDGAVLGTGSRVSGSGRAGCLVGNLPSRHPGRFRDTCGVGGMPGVRDVPVIVGWVVLP